MLHHFLLAVVHRYALGLVASVDVDIYVYVAVVDKHRLVGRARLALVCYHLRILLGRLLGLRSLWLTAAVLPSFIRID